MIHVGGTSIFIAYCRAETGAIPGTFSQVEGRRNTSWLKNLKDWYGVSSISLFRSAVSKVSIAMKKKLACEEEEEP